MQNLVQGSTVRTSAGSILSNVKKSENNSLSILASFAMEESKAISIKWLYVAFYP